MDARDGFYQLIKGDHFAYRYEVLHELGRGAFGQVLKCRDHKENGKLVAVKVNRKEVDFEG